MGEEDCLILNVHTPVDSLSRSELLPVMFWIHGGGYVAGSSSDQLYGAEYLVKKDVVFVSINYRIGPLGFLNMNTPEVPGNAGLKDQALALKWVNKNIQHFGGDPNRVTIFGESAGSSSVHYLLASPLTKGLFQRAICQSGVTSNHWTLQKHPEEPVMRMIESLNIKSNNPDEILSELIKRPAMEIVSAVPSRFDTYPLYFPFVPSVEKIFPGVDSFITRDPVEIFMDGDYTKCPTILGFNDNEGILLLWTWYRKRFKENPTPEDFIANFESIMPYDIADKLKAIDGNLDKHIEKVVNLYFNSGRDVYQQYADLGGDLTFIDGINIMANIMARHSPIYLYKFVYKGDRNSFTRFFPYNYQGASHFDDIGYLFHMMFFDEKNTGETSTKMMDYFQSLWTDFAKYVKDNKIYNLFLIFILNYFNRGNIEDYNWTPATKDKLNCLVIDETKTMVDAPFSNTIYFWENLRKTLNISMY